MKQYAEYATEKAVELLNIDSPSGYTKEASDWVYRSFEQLGYKPVYTKKGGVIVDFGGDGNGLFLEAHMDTLGLMIAQIKKDGRLRVTNIGGIFAGTAECSNVRVRTHSGKVYEGTVQFVNASMHVNKAAQEAARTYENVEVVLDEDVKSDEDVKKLGIDVGDFVCVEPKTRVTESGYIKSHFLDDKLSVAILLGFGKYLKDNKVSLRRRVVAHFTVFEEVGHGGSASIPEGITEAISVDMGCVGEGLQCTEKMVSICAKDAGGPYHYDIVEKLIEAAKKEDAAYAVDLYPYYRSDVETTLEAGADVCHGLIGPGVYASHGYERSHKEAVLNTLKLLKGYLDI